MEATPSTLPTPEPKNRGGAGRWLAAFLLGVVLVVALVAIGLSKTASPFVTMVKSLPGIVEKFKTGTITNTFLESIPEVTSTHGDILEVATSRCDETFRKEDAMSILWDTVYLGTTTSEIRVPVTFRYHVRLSDPTWRLAVRGNVCVVEAPAIRPSLPPAIHTDHMEKMTVNGWARFNKDDNLFELEKSITPTLEKRAMSPSHLRFSREACRESVAEFVKKWLITKDRWRADRLTAIIVVFPDEGKFDSDQQLEKAAREPSVKLEGRRD